LSSGESAVAGPSGQTLATTLPVLTVMLLTRLSFGAIAIIFPVYVHASGTATGISLALYPLLEAFSAPTLGSYSDKTGRRRVFTAGLFSLAVLNFAMGFSRNYDVVSFIHALMGISAAAVTVSTLALITDYTRRSNRGRWMGGFDMSNLTGYALGFLFGSFFTQHFTSNLSVSFFIVSGLLAATSLLSFLLVHDVKIERVGSIILNPLTGVDSGTLSLLPIWFSLTTVIGVAFFLPKALSTNGVAQTTSGLLLFGVVLLLGLGSIAWGFVSDHIGRLKTLGVGMIGLVLFLLAAIDLVTSPSSLLNPSRLAVLAPLILMLSAVVPSLLAAVGDNALVQRRGSVMGLYSLLLSLGLATGNVIAGVAFDWLNLKGVLIVALAEVAINIAIAFVISYAVRGRGGRATSNPSS
jgi:MFS family permease